ncbi:MAG TPA: PAS domain S-box protein [Polyangiaceae bacterium]
MKALLVGEGDAVETIAERLPALGYGVVRVSAVELESELASSDGAVVILFASGVTARARVAELRGPSALSTPPLLVVSADKDEKTTFGALYAAGADDCLAWPRDEALLPYRLSALRERIDLRRKLADGARVEAELRTREERLRTLIHLASDAIFIKDRGGRYVFINPEGARSLGFTPEAVIGRTDLELFAEPTGRDILAYDQLAMKCRQPIHYEARRIIQGEERHFTTAKFAYVSPEGDLLGIAGITRDTTDLKKAEAAEDRRTEQRLAHQASLLELAHMETAPFDAAIEKILHTAANALSIGRVAFFSLRDDLTSRELHASRAETWTNALELRARDLPRYFETLQENRVYALDDARATTKATPLERAYLEPNTVRSVLDAPVWLRGSLVGVVCHEATGSAPRPWTTEEHDFAMRIGHMVSMTLGDRERDQAAAELRRSESRMRTLIEHLPDAVFVVREGCLVFVNAAFAAYLGYDAPEEVIGARLLDVVHAEDDREGAAIAAGSPRPRKVRMLRRDGETVYAEVAGLALVWDGEPATVATARDLTERNRLEAQLLLADRMASVGTLAAGVAHEINNPLGYVLGNLSALLASGADSLPNELRQTLSDAVHGAKRVRDIVQDLQTFSRGDSSKKSAPIDVLRVMDVSIRMAHSAVRHRARLERDYREVPAVVGSESRLGQVFLNLIVNAAQAMPERALDQNEIRVKVESDASEVIVEVRDNGVGMTEEVRRRIFDPFYTTKPVGEGTGLGLAICHNIVTALGGTLDAESTPGLGSTFRLRLPASRAPSRTDLTEPPPPSVERREKVLVIDDEPMIGVMIRRLLAAHCDVLPVTSPREALRRIVARERFDVILCDLMMPRMDGMEFYAELSIVAPEMARRTGFLTGGAVTAQARRFLLEHADRVVEKPVELGKLRAFVRALAKAADVAPVSSVPRSRVK